MSSNRFYKCTGCGNLEDAFMTGFLTNMEKLVCSHCHKPTKKDTINPIIDFKKNRKME